MCDDNGDPFIATLHNLLLTICVCNKLLSIIMLMILGYTYLFHKGFCNVYFGAKEKMHIRYHILHKKTCILGGNKVNIKEIEISIQRKIALELLHQRLDHRSTKSLLDGGTDNVWLK